MKELFWISLGHASAMLGSLSVVKVMTHFLDPAVYGEVALAMTGALFVQNIILGPCCNSLSRYYVLAKEQNKIKTYFLASQKLFTEAVIASLVMALIIIFGSLIAGFYKYILQILIAAMLAIISGSSSAFDTIQTARRERKIVAWHQGVQQWTRVLCVVVAILLFGKTSITVLLGACFGAFIPLISQAIFLKNSVENSLLQNDVISVKELNKQVSQMKKFCFPFLIWGIFGWLQSSSDKWALGASNSTSDVGRYAVLMQLSLAPTTIFAGVIAQFISPIIYEKAGSGLDLYKLKNAANINKNIFKIIMILTILITIVLYLNHRKIFSVLTDSKYSEVSYLMPWVFLSGGVFSGAQILSMSLLLHFKSQTLLWPKVGTAILAIILYFGVAPRFGLNGLVVASLFVASIYTVWIYLLSEKNLSGTIRLILSQKT